MDESKQKTTIDELDIDELIEETKDLLDEEEPEQPKKEEPPEKPKEEKKKKKIPVFPIIWVFLSILIVFLTFLFFKELKRKPDVKTGYFTINKKIIYISNKKIALQKLKNEIKKYDFKLLIAYKFASVSGIKIMKALVITKFSSKADVPLNKLYSLIKDKIYKQFKKLTKGKYIEDIKNYRNIIVKIIKENTLETIKDVIPGINMDKVRKNFKIDEFIIF